jgi:hypothetical protein
MVGEFKRFSFLPHVVLLLTKKLSTQEQESQRKSKDGLCRNSMCMTASLLQVPAMRLGHPPTFVASSHGTIPGAIQEWYTRLPLEILVQKSVLVNISRIESEGF